MQHASTKTKELFSVGFSLFFRLAHKSSIPQIVFDKFEQCLNHQKRHFQNTKIRFMYKFEKNIVINVCAGIRTAQWNRCDTPRELKSTSVKPKNLLGYIIISSLYALEQITSNKKISQEVCLTPSFILLSSLRSSQQASLIT